MRRKNTFIESFAKNLYKLRTSKGMTQQEVADRAEMTVMAYNRIESKGEQDVRLSTIYSLSRALNLKPQELFDF